MTIKIQSPNYNGIIVVDSIQEFQLIIRKLRKLDSGKHSCKYTKTDFSMLYKSLLNTREGQLINMLSQYENGATDIEICRNLNISNNKRLAKIKSYITTEARLYGVFNINRIIITNWKMNSNGNRQYIYRLSDLMMETVKQENFHKN